MVAGEASGDLLASLVIPGLQSHWADVALQGIGGPKMKALGFDAGGNKKNWLFEGMSKYCATIEKLLG
jgi:lipid-A-disaccharide synthase